MSSDVAVILPIPASIATDSGTVLCRFGGSAALAHCLRTMLEPRRRGVEGIVAVADSLFVDVRASLAADGVSVEVVAASGSGTRADCLIAGLGALKGAAPYVLVHDIRRPLASVELRDRVVDSLRRGNDVVVPALPMVDSVKTADSLGAVRESVDRAFLRSVQFPRGYRKTHLNKCLEEADADGFDELEYTVRAGIPVTMVDGDPDAFALEMPRDQGLADAIFSCRMADQR
jgi:2-C-methyl-D-erythritol 4-phosphate cytidylyltransferase